MGQYWLIIVFLLSMVYLFVAIGKFKMNPFFAMITASIIIGIIVGLDLVEVVNVITTQFGGVLASLGIVVTLGGLLGSFLGEAGGTDSLANWMLDTIGEAKASLSMNITGLLVSIPVYFGAAYVVLNPLLKVLSEKTKKPIQTYVTSLSVGLLVTHCMVIPTPGPLTVSSTLGANVGWFIVYSLVLSVPASLIAGWLYGEWLGTKFEYVEVEEITEPVEMDSNANNSEVEVDTNHAPAGLAMALIGLPLLLIVGGTIIPNISNNANIVQISEFLTTGSGVMSLLISVIVAAFTLKPYIKKDYGEVVTDSFNSFGEILLLLGAGGSFGGIITASGIGDYFVELLTSWNVPLVILAFLLCILLRTALGSAAIAMVTSSAIVAPIALQLGTSPIILGLTICAASLAIATPTDAAFWLVQQLDDLSVRDTVLTYTLGNVLACMIIMFGIFLMTQFSHVLPGLY